MALLEGRRILSYNLAGPRGAFRFASGALAGFLALSLLVAMLAWGGWLRFDAAFMPVAQALRLGALWGCAFLVVASVEEGLFRCYALFTLARGINFWWALAAEIGLCGDMYLHSNGNGAWGVYLISLLGLFPCLALHQKSASRSAFWQAAWVTSTAFAYYHTLNNGENWMGVFAAGAIGFVFCISVRLTGSAWWAIGFHAVWDWAETYFYGAADSGLQGKGHFLSATPAGNPLWSGGSDGPEGSLLVLVVIVVLTISLFAIYGRGRQAVPSGA
jgi:membrane protease YdiL (CAAX protease family)